MHPDFSDIRSRIEEPPTWFDSNGTPRYGSFSPGVTGVYDDCALLVGIECEACSARFLVGVGWSDFDRMEAAELQSLRTDAPFELTDRLTWLERNAKGFHYGDPPRHAADGDPAGPRCAGETMNCNDVRIVEAWLRDGIEWKRHPELEGVFAELGPAL